jgi:hypothetical protein
VEVEWLPVKLGPTRRGCPGRAASTSATTGATADATTATGSPRTTGPRSTFTPTGPAPRSPWRSAPSPKNGDAVGHTARRCTTPSSSRGRTWGMRGFVRGGGGGRVRPGPDLRPALRARGGFEYRGARGTDRRRERGGTLPRRGLAREAPRSARRTARRWLPLGGVGFYRVQRHCFCYKPATNMMSRVIGNHWGAP